ncbi:hypothetical protein DERF_012975 [Dermatophagoides farinae]|uniref:Uncharacterized protein n=1 Tax=Dermatophagoides farinae TaxID=6954 RepID=A0A922HNN2_DERFA|nr:hypothetical protein DERF_015060 [Dermatophagoides farinae]KAH9496954.1 hypothetical protein DERF_012975 [Dermatophagoides farinae]
MTDCPSRDPVAMVHCLISVSELIAPDRLEYFEKIHLCFFRISLIISIPPNDIAHEQHVIIPRLTLPRLALIRYNAVQLPYITLHCYIVYEG